MKTFTKVNETIQSTYRAKHMSAVDAIHTLVKNASFVTFGCYAATPVALSKAYADAAREGLFQTIIDTYLFRSSTQVVSYFNDPSVLESIRLIMPFIGGEIGALINTARSHIDKIQYPEFTPGHFSHFESDILTQYGKPDVHMFQVSPMDQRGYFSFGLDGSFSIPMARMADKVIVEVNPNFPRTFGDGIIHVTDVDAIVEHKSDLLSLPRKPSNDTDYTIASYLDEFIGDGACVQLGVGGVPDSVGQFLKKKADLGIHTELLSGSLVDLISNGNVTNKHKNIDRYHTMFNVAMLPSTEYYNYLDNNPSILCAPASYVNNPETIAKIDNMISVNSFLEIDLFGQVASEALHWHQLTGTGGQVDFVRGATASKGGKSFLAAHSTTKNNTISKIVPKLNNIVTTPRTDVQHVVTEYGCVNLAGMSNRNRAKALIGLAHPDFREWLVEQATEMGLM